MPPSLDMMHDAVLAIGVIGNPRLSWSAVRPWLGATVFIYEVLQPLWGRPVEPLIMGAATVMMGLDALSRAGATAKRGIDKEP